MVALLAAEKDALLTRVIPYLDEIRPLCYEMDEDLALVLAVIQTESGFRPSVVSTRGAVGLMQVTPDTARWMAGQIGLDGYTDDKLYEKQWNLTIGISYMQYLRRLFDGNLPQALAAYNAGPTRVRAWLEDGDWDGSVELIDDIPYGETRNYVKKVLKSYDRYRRLQV